MSVREIARSENYLSENCPSGNGPLGKYLRGTVRQGNFFRGNVRWGTVVGPNLEAYLSLCEKLILTAKGL